jgi:dTDP-4-dehydrorhamnose reductase
MQNLIVLGADGQLGKKISHDFKSAYKVIPFDRSKCDLNNLNMLRDVIESYKPSVVVNCAAYTNVDRAEEDFDRCLSVNYYAVKTLAELSNELKFKLIHFSTDYIFNEKNHIPIKENNAKDPINNYGISKLRGENAIEQVCRDFYIFRTSWVYSNNGSNFPKTILGLAKEKEILDIVDDQFGSPTSVNLISSIVLLSLKKNIKKGIYHISPEGVCSWFDIATEILKYTQQQNGFILQNINSVSSSQFSTKAKRPNFSYLDNSKIKKILGVEILNWRVYFQKFLMGETE